MTNPLRLIVPTTLGPSQIVYLGREDAALKRSTICLNGTSTQAGIDQEYNAFVRQPTGVVERLTGHAAFRIDVSKPIDAGSSWQLAVLTAHAAEHADQLEQVLERDAATAGTLVWATGTVRSVDLAIGEVGHVPEKLRQSLALFEKATAESFDCHVLIPQGNRAEVPASLIIQVQKLGVAVHFVSSFDEVRDILALARPAKAEAADQSGEIVWQGNPFLGLESYGPEHRPVFFGRARAREECLAVLRKAAAQDTPFLLIHGRSGVGKSSLMRAGLAGDVKRFASEGGAWTHIDVRLSDQGDPALAIARVLAGRRHQSIPDEELAQSLLHDPSGSVSARLGSGDQASVLLTLDQLEQIYADDDIASLARLERVLTALLETGRVWIVATMRTDQLELLAETPALMRLAKAERTYVLDRPSLSETTEIIVQPLAAAGLRFDDEAKGRQLVADLAEVAIASPDSLPLLQVVLMRMADMADQSGTIPVQAYERLGGFEQTAARWAETAASALLDGTVTETDLSRALGELIRIDTDTGQALSRSAPRTDATGAQTAIFDALVQARLLTVETINEGAFVRLAHETLIAHWQRLNDLVGTLRNDLQIRDWLDRQARHWVDGDKNEADLIRNAQRLAAARQAIEQGVVPIKPSTQDFVTASEEHLQQQRDAQSAREQRDRRNRLLAGVAAALTVTVGFGAWALFERNQADNQANLAQLAVERAETEAALAAEQAARAEDAERAAEQARELQDHAEVASANLVRMLNLRDVQDATALATEGRRDLTLLWLHDSFERLLDAEFLGSDGFSEEREESIIALDSVLRRAAAESRYEIPGDAVGFGLRNVLYYQVPSQNTLWRAQVAGPPINIGPLSGRVLEVYDLLPPLGAVLATRNDNQLVFRRFDPSEGSGEIVLTVPSEQTSPEWDISMGPDGVALIRERMPEEALRNDPDVVLPVFLARLDEGKTERLSDDGRYWLNTGEGGVSFLEARLEEDAEAAESLGVESVPIRDHIGLGGDYTQCLGADAARDQAPLYEQAIRSVADFANRIRCDAEGDFLAISAVTHAPRGPVDRLHLVDVRALAEGERRRTEITKPYNYASGISLFASPEQYFGELVHHNSRTLYLSAFADEPSRTLTLPRTIETAVALGQERAAIVMSQGVGTQDTKLLSIVDFNAADDFGKTMLPKSVEPLGAASAVGQMHGLRDYDDPQRQNCVDFSEQADWTASDTSMVTVSSPAGDAEVPRAWLQQSNCIKISPSGEYAALWADGALNVLETQNSTTIATYEVDREPGDFIFSECCGAALLITEANAVVHKPIPSFTTTLDVEGAMIARGYPRDTEPAYPILLADGPILRIELSPEESRLIYTVATGAGTLETRLHSMELNRTWKTLGVSSNFLDSYFIDEDTISYWDPSRSYIYEIPQLSEAKSLIAGALSEHCKLRGDRAETSDCIN